MASDGGVERAGLRGVPGWERGVRLLVGVVVALVGVFLMVKPFSSLSVLWAVAVVGLVGAALSGLVRVRGGEGRRGWVEAVVCGLAAAVVAWWPGVTVSVVATVVAVAMIVAGVMRGWSARRVRGVARWDAALGGVALLVFGLSALAWPDITVLAVAVLFGAGLLVIGVRQTVEVVGGATRSDTGAVVAKRPGWHLVGTSVAAVAALVLGVTGVVLQHDAPAPDAFYTAPADVADRPGRLLRSEPYHHPQVPDGALAWRILYTTTRDEGRPAIASGLVIAPAHAATTATPVLAWAHGTTGAAPGCAPSILDAGLSSGAMMVPDKVIGQGWTMVATDYVGLGTTGPHPYLIGQGEARSVLDAVRAARQLTDIHLADETVVWGHSQGGHAALWTGILAPAYAPDLRIDGIAALAPAADLPALAGNLEKVTGGDLFESYLVSGYTGTYPDVTYGEYVRPAARVITREMSQRCLAEKGVLVSVLTSLVLDKPIWKGDPARGALLARMRENVPAGPIPAPLFIGQGGADTLILPAGQDAYVADRCHAGYQVDYQRYPDRDHVPLVEPDSPLIPDLLAWTTDRFAGKPAPSTC